MELTITDVDYAPADLYDQVPVVTELLKEIPGDDRPDYWLAVAKTPLNWLCEEIERKITHVVVAARWVGTQIEPGIDYLPIGLAYVLDESLLHDQALDSKKNQIRCYRHGYGYDRKEIAENVGQYSQGPYSQRVRSRKI